MIMYAVFTRGTGVYWWCSVMNSKEMRHLNVDVFNHTRCQNC